MNIEKLQKANELQMRIHELEMAKDCFYWDFPNEERISRNPSIIIEVDDGDNIRTTFNVPAKLSREMALFILDFIETELLYSQKAFDEL